MIAEVLDTERPASVSSLTLAIAPSGNALDVADTLERISLALAKAQTIQRVRKIHAAAKAAAVYAREQKLGRRLIEQAHAVTYEAMRRLGGMLAEMAKAAGGRPYHFVTGTSRVPVQTLRDLGLSKNESSRAQLLFQLPDETFRKIRDGQMSLLRALAAQKRERELEEQIEQINRARDARRADVDLRLCDGVDLPASGSRPQLVITEPPMDSLQALAAACVGVPFVVFRVPQAELETVLTVVGQFLTRQGFETPPDSLLHPAAKVRVLFCNGAAITQFKERLKSRPLRNPLFDSWQERVISKLSMEGDLICDPFMRSAKTALAALGQHRRFLGGTLDTTVLQATRRAIEAQA